jgi:RNA polymerase sigma factor (sigma-70 family)
VTAPRKALREQPPAESDAELLSRVRVGDNAALGSLFDRHAVALHQFVRRAAPREDPDDVVQEAFIRVTRAAAGYQQRSESARSWLFGIAYAIVRERRRASARFTRALARFAGIESQRSATPEGGVRTEIERHLDALDPQKREVVILTEMLGMTGPEAAAILDIPVGTVWTRLHHARRELRENLEKSDV